MKKFCRVTSAVLLFLAINVRNAPLFAMKVEAASELEVIDSEILDTNYNHALLLIKEFINKYPECFDDAQKRVKKIMKARDDYASLSKELIEVIINDPENNEKKLAIIDRLQALEKRPSAQALAFIAQAKSAAQFTYYRAIFNRIMSEGSVLVASQKYPQAVSKFHEGFTLYQFDFFNNTLDTELTEPVRLAISEIEKQIPAYETIQNSLKAACEAFNKAVKSGNYLASITAYNTVQKEFERFANLRNAVCKAGIQVDEIFARMKKIDPELTDSSFLPFLSRFTFGRATNPDTGIIGAMDAQRNILIEEMKKNVYQQIVSQSKTFEDSVIKKDIFRQDNSKRECLTFMQSFSTIGLSVNELYGFWQNRDGTFYKDFCPNYTQSMKYATLLATGLGKQVDTISYFKSMLNRIPEPEKAFDSVEEFRFKNKKYAENLVNLVPAFAAVKNDSVQQMNEQWYIALTSPNDVADDSGKENIGSPVAPKKTETGESGAGVTAVSSVTSENTVETEKNTRTTAGIQILDEKLEWNIALETLESLCKKTANLADEQSVNNWKTLAAFYADSGEKIVTEYEKQYNWANLLVTQTSGEKVSPDGNKFETGLYPEESRELVLKLEPERREDRSRLVESLDVLKRGVEYRNSFEVSEKSIEQSINKLDSFGVLSKNISAKAEEGILLASSSWNEGDLRYEQALQALRRDDFNASREYLQRARSKYNESLAYQTSLSRRETSDSKLNTLGEQIAAKENTVVVAEVRRLKNQARNAYYSGAFEEAENLLARAKSRWAATNVEEDAEITALSSLVITALSIQSGRVILPTAPLYPEMSQILSIANQYYDQGKAMMENNQKAQAMNILQQAKDKLRELQLVYPLNQDASLLTLKIDKLIDEKSFDQMFERRVNSARQSYKNPSKRQTAYTDLLDLYAINPGYPGLAKLIYDVEIEIGIRQKPVDRAALQKSNSLTADAQKIVNSSRDEIQLRRALSLVDQAISLNPQNENAAILKDRIQISIGGKATVVLSSEDEMRYQKAIQELQNNNIIEAYALVQRLMQSPKNSRSPKVLDLQKKVQALL